MMAGVTVKRGVNTSIFIWMVILQRGDRSRVVGESFIEGESRVVHFF